MCTLTVVCLNTGSLKEIEAHQDLLQQGSDVGG